LRSVRHGIVQESGVHFLELIITGHHTCVVIVVWSSFVRSDALQQFESRRRIFCDGRDGILIFVFVEEVGQKFVVHGFCFGTGLG
jgi:hypothetical protein